MSEGKGGFDVAEIGLFSAGVNRAYHAAAESMTVVEVRRDMGIDLPRQSAVQQCGKIAAPRTRPSHIAEGVYLIRPTARIPKVVAGGQPQAVERRPQLNTLDRKQHQLAARVVEVHQVVERELRVSACGG